MRFGERLPDLPRPVPGARSRALAERLARVESRNITRAEAGGPIFWTEAAGANVRDVDGNTYIDLTAGFGVAAAGHAAHPVTEAIRRQARRLVHALGDVHPADLKVELLERLAALAPGQLSVSILSSNGGDAVESALKTAMLATGRPGVVAFHGAYHGLGYGALAVTWPERFRAPFRRQLYAGIRFAPFPAAGPAAGAAVADSAPTSEAALAEVRALVEASTEGEDPVGAVIVEPIQGRAGVVVPPDDFLPGLRALCNELGALLILDEVYTGLGRTGRWFACQHADVVPDILVVGKALGGGLPISAAIGTPDVMDAWPPSAGEAIHTSTFLGNPVACAAALAQLRQIEDRGLVERAAGLGARLRATLDGWVDRYPALVRARGLGLMQAVVFADDDGAETALRVADAALRAGVIVLTEGPALALTPPLVITERQLDHATGVIEGAVAALP